MRIFMTGATGYIGTVVTERLKAAGHEIVGLAQLRTSADELAWRGCEVVLGGLRNPSIVRDAAHHAEAVIHLANSNDAEAGRLDQLAVEAILDGLKKTHRPFLYTSAIWVLGSTGDVVADESAPTRPPALAAWRVDREKEVVEAASRRIRTVVIRAANVFGRGGGTPARFIHEAEETGQVRLVAGGQQRWPWVFVDDLADLYVRALDAPAGSLYNAVWGESVPLRQIAAAACHAAGVPENVKSLTLEYARRQLGDIADTLALDQQASGEKAERELDWHPTGPDVLEDIAHGSYGPERAQSSTASAEA